eukprot:TRINITY_DN30869_c0_g1_i1.p1 TRINITY_DN30869_c0_g1~~TRINITY_DN30869_c0_g1_i1.p1  ORF type:complete len:482 (+),score=10.14 TRINITY_DN30869_c0_g1_i1:165-1610(+)
MATPQDGLKRSTLPSFLQRLLMISTIASTLFVIVAFQLYRTVPVSTSASKFEQRQARPWSEGERELHFAWVTDCSPYQEWQSLALIRTIYQHQGASTAITRLISGCESKDEKDRIRTHEAAFPTGSDRSTPNLFFTEAHIRNEELNDTYPPYNRPFSIARWVASGNLHPDTLVVLLDPDMVMLAPLRLPLQGNDLLYRGQGGLEGARKLPALGQRYRYLGGRWEQTAFELEKICEVEAAGCLDLTRDDVAEFFSVGPPWIMSFGDLRRAAPLWYTYTRRIRRQSKQLIAEMYAYSLAFASLGVKHALFDHFVVSYPNAPSDEQAWAWIDDAISNGADSCSGDPPGSAVHSMGNAPLMPTFLHYCEIYHVEDWYWRKREVNHSQIMTCSEPLFAEVPPEKLRKWRATSSRRADSGSENSDWNRNSLRQAWYLCHLLPALNSALVSVREALCPEGYNDARSSRVLPKDAFSEALAAFFNKDAG